MSASNLLEETRMNEMVPLDIQTLYSIGAILIIVGFSIIILATVLLFIHGLKAKKERKTRYGGAIIIGPIPIIFGTDKETAKILLMLALALTISLIILMVIFYFMYR